MCHKQ